MPRRPITLAWLGAFIALTLGNVAYSQEDATLATETVPASEARDIAKVAARFQAAIIKRDSGLTRRGAHPKHHGCVRARFTINAELRPDLRVGLFQAGVSYPAWIRYSNNGDPQADSEGDVRGMAIKLLDVDGPRLYQPDSNATTHDVLLVSHPAFLFPDVSTYAQAFEAFGEGHALRFFFNPFDPHLRAFLISRDMLVRHADLLDIRWFSMTPYLFGAERAVKYSATPCAIAQTLIPSAATDDFLRVQLAKRLREDNVCFTFAVQFQTDARRMPIEDASVEWDETDSPFIPMARIDIPRQSFASPSSRISVSSCHLIPGAHGFSINRWAV